MHMHICCHYKNNTEWGNQPIWLPINLSGLFCFLFVLQWQTRNPRRHLSRRSNSLRAPHHSSEDPSGCLSSSARWMVSILIGWVNFPMLSKGILFTWWLLEHSGGDGSWNHSYKAISLFQLCDQNFPVSAPVLGEIINLLCLIGKPTRWHMENCCPQQCLSIQGRAQRIMSLAAYMKTPGLSKFHWLPNTYKLMVF